MKKFTSIKSKVIPLPIEDIDTDLIIPAQFLTSISSSGYGKNLFRRLRDTNPEFPFNLDIFKGARILVCGSNFGCGSSREHAVWALLEAGIEVVLAASFADIFASNSAKNGLLLVTLPSLIVDSLVKEATSGDYVLNVDLESQKVTLPSGQTHFFAYDDFRKHCLLQGLDDIDYILSHGAEIYRYQQKRADKQFYVTTKFNNATSYENREWSRIGKS